METLLIAQEELEAYVREENEREQANGLFSTSSQWFKFSSYEIIKNKYNEYYIIPEKNSTMTIYEPFKLFPKILVDYLELITNLKELENKYNLTKANILWEDIAAKEYLKHDLNRAKLLLPFIENYGLFGLFNEYIERIEPECNSPTIDYDKYIAVLKPNSRFLKRLNYNIKRSDNSYSIEYEKLAGHFLPRLSSPFPNIAKHNKHKPLFYENYAENIYDMLMGISKNPSKKT